MTLAALVVLVLGACGPPARSTAPLSGVTLGTPATLFGFIVCSPVPLHACVGTTPLRHGTRVTPPVDIEATPSCAGQEAAAAAACPGSLADRATLECFARRGVLYDAGAVDAPGIAPPRPSHFELACDEGVASIDFIEPF